MLDLRRYTLSDTNINGKIVGSVRCVKRTRVTTRNKINFRKAKFNEEQINEAVQKLKTILPLKNKLTKAPWLGSRPTIADSLPMIGKAPKHKNLWFNFGHNHIGLSTSAGSGVVLADMIENKKPSINIDPFLPDRFML